MQPVRDTLSSMFPHVTEPFICNAPMFGTANAALVAAVTKAGGFGFVGGGFDFTPSGPQLTALEKEFTEARQLLGLSPISSGEADETLPIGVGFLTFNAPTKPQEALIPLLRRHRPAAVWLFAPASPEQHVSLIASLKAAGESWGLKAFVQVGTIQSAMEAVQHGADVLVVQGSDAGGHQFAGNSSIVTLLPEIHDLLNEIGKEIPVLAAGGIMDGRGMTAALALGANGFVMGTRFIATVESPAPEVVKSVLVSTKDGGSSTSKSIIHDKITGRDIWPSTYNGRAVISNSFKEAVAGKVAMEEIVEKQKKATAEGDRSRMVIWAGSGLGLIKSILTVEEVIRRCRQEVSDIIESLNVLDQRMRRRE